MTGFQFAMLSVFGIPALIVGLLLLAHRVTPPHVWKSWPVQTVATILFLGVIAVPVAIIWLDSQGDYFEDRYSLVADGLGIPANAEVRHQRFNTLGNCWSNGVNWSPDVTFSSVEALDRWFDSEAWHEPLPRQIAGYFDVPMESVAILDGALDRAERDEKYFWSKREDVPEWHGRIIGYTSPFVCTAIERDEAADTLTLRRCDPIAQPIDTGSGGRVILRASGSPGKLIGHMNYLGGPPYCSNPLRRGLNRILGLPHPEGEIDTNLPGF